MDTATGDVEAPKDPGVQQTHYQSFSEKDFEGKYKCWYNIYVYKCLPFYIARIPYRNDVIHVANTRNTCELIIWDKYKLITGAARSKAWVCGLSLAGIAGSNPSGDMEVCLLCFCVLWDRGLCDGLISGPKVSYWMWWWSLHNEEDLAQQVLLHNKKNIYTHVLVYLVQRNG